MEMARPIPAFLSSDNKPEGLGSSPESERVLMDSWGSDPSAEVSPPPIGPGLRNLGNTCFLNAVLQCVTHTVPLVQGLRATPHQSPCSPVTGGGVGGEGRFCSLCALRQHLEKCFYAIAMGKIVSPGGFVNNLTNLSSSFNRYQQEDAHEFLNCLLDSLHTSCLDPQSRDGPSSLQQDSFIKQIFGGRLRSQVKCCDCGHVSNTFEPLLDLSLEIEDAKNLEEALESFTKVEKIEDPETKFTCDGCNSSVSVQKQFTLDQAPPVVAFHLKRFKSNGYFATKIDRFVEYPVNLDLKPFLSTPNDDGLTYELYAVLVHDGRCSFFGHYYCFIRSSPDVWYLMDDAMVDRRNEQQALEQRAYILFYMKQGTPWFSSFMEEQRAKVDVNIISMASSFHVLGHMEKSQNSSPDCEGNLKCTMETLNKDESLDWHDGASLDAYMSQAGTMNCKDVMRIPWVDEKGKPSGCPFEDTDLNDAERDHVSCSLEASKCDEPLTKVNQLDTATDCLNMASCMPTHNRLSSNKFYNETWDEDEKENLPKLHPSVLKGKCVNEADDREQAALVSCMRSRPSSRRNCFEQFMPVQRPGNSEHRRRKRKQRLEHQNVPGLASSMPTRSQVPCSPLDSNVLHKPLVGGDSQVDFAVDSNHSDKTKTD